MGPDGVNDVMHWKCGLRIFEIWKSQFVEFLPPKKKVDFRSSPRPCDGCRTWCRADGKVSRERLCISSLMSKNLLKSFVPELRCHKCFFVFWDSYVIYIWVMNILCLFHISISWVCYTHAGYLIPTPFYTYHIWFRNTL